MGTESQNDIFVLIGKIDFGKKMQKNKKKLNRILRDRFIYVRLYLWFHI